MRIALISILVMMTLSLRAQGPYAPAANSNGTTAIHKDSAVFAGWATTCKVERGYMNISDPSNGKASVGDSSSALGEAMTNGIVSLGDAGTATLTFDATLYNGPGWDFAIFENGFTEVGGGDYLELAFVEVSSDGQNFYRFPAHSLTDTSGNSGSFITLDPTQLNNFAGKYLLGYGTPFDLEELSEINGLDINAISHLRVVDVVGTKQSQFATYDTANLAVLDPYPTAFPSGGFDLDAVGAIHMNPVGLKENRKLEVEVFPNPTSDVLYIKLNHLNNVDYSIFNQSGKRIKAGRLKQSNAIDLYDFPNGMYYIKLIGAKSVKTIKMLKQ